MTHTMPHRTRIKICGITREADALAAVRLGADALGFVFYPPSPRAVSIARAKALASLIPPFVTLVGLFVNEKPEVIRAVLDEVPLQLLQFHGDETERHCQGYGLPFMKAARVRPGLDLVEYAAAFPNAQALLLDAFVEGYGGGGKTFDWDLIPSRLPLPLVLSGGLDQTNVTEAVQRIRPWAVDCSSGVEAAKGIKDESKIAAFIAGVRAGDA